MSRGRWVWFVLLGWLGLLSATTWWPLLVPAFLPMPQVALVVVLYLAMCGPGSATSSGQGQEIGAPVVVGAGCFLGYVADVLSGTPVGLQATVMALFALGLRGVFSQLLLRGSLFSMGVMGVVVVLYQLALYGIWLWMDQVVSWTDWHRVLWLCVTTVVATPAILFCLRKIDRRFRRIAKGSLVLS